MNSNQRHPPLNGGQSQLLTLFTDKGLKHIDNVKVTFQKPRKAVCTTRCIFLDFILIFPFSDERIRVRLSPASADGSLEAEMSVNHQPNPHYTSPCSGERVLGRWVLLEDVAVFAVNPESNTQVGASLK